MIAFKVKGDYVGGKFRRVRGAARRIVSIDPGDSGRRTAAFPIHPPHIDLAIEAAAAAFPKWADTPIDERADYLRKFAAEVYNRRDDFAAIISTETGKPLWESRREVDMVKTQVETEIREGIRPVSPFRVGEVRFGVSGAARYAPLGAVAVLGAAISPVHLPCAHIVPALLSGCTVVFKPSKLVPCTGQLLAEVFDEIELPAGVFNMVQGDAEYGQKVAEDPRLAGLYFTGTLEAGRQLLLVACHHPHRLVALQMGGVNLAVVCADAGLERAVAACVEGTFLTTGQQYTATSVILAEKKVLEPFCQMLVDCCRRLRVGYHDERNVFMGPLLTEAARERFLDSQQKLEHRGLKALMRAEALRMKRPGYYVGPAVWLAEGKMTPDQIRPTGLNFGPDIVVVPYSGEGEGVELARGNRWPLAAAVFTEDDERFEYWARRIPYGLCNHNLPTTELSLRLPVDFPRECGNHRAGGVLAQRNFTRPVAILKNKNPFDQRSLPPGLPVPRRTQED